MNNHIMIIDTETIDIQKSFVYDIGIIIAEKQKDGRYKEIAGHSFIIRQVYDNRELFMTAYYANKKPLYVKSLRSRKSIKKHFGHALQFIDKMLELYKIKQVYAYNSPFDKGALNFTANFYKTRQPLQGIEWKDLQAISNQLIHSQDAYKNFCKENGFITEKGYYQMNAEKTYAYIKETPEFKEEHTGLADCRIELEILNENIKRGYKNQTWPKQFFKV
jgi:hypothetical protein